MTFKHRNLHEGTAVITELNQAGTPVFCKNKLVNEVDLSHVLYFFYSQCSHNYSEKSNSIAENSLLERQKKREQPSMESRTH